eukprot:m.146040 g.146040  ORF g.146040 m.146040 type:complete len:58 (+) comp14961_c0_seq2:1366-1539(+)
MVIQSASNFCLKCILTRPVPKLTALDSEEEKVVNIITAETPKKGSIQICWFGIEVFE